ncbi:MAG: hypothetical protein IKF19_02690 [Bacilli bacterium]|nr:hypothetical protein [Bacilli bacterium]
MKDAINYYYNLNPSRINRIFNYYYFYIDNELYYFVMYNRNINDINSIYNLNQEINNLNINVNEIIVNKDKNPVTVIRNTPYVLMKIYININKYITLPEVSYLSNIKVHYDNNLMRSNWLLLWTKKIDYLEYHQEQNYKKYPLLTSTFDYFVGLSENAIIYLNNVISKMNPTSVDIGVISHDIIRIDDTIHSLYNPLNIIIDHKARDLAEYIKVSFFKDNYNIFEELDEYFRYNYFSYYGINLLVARILYPSFYFDLYDDIINNRIDETSILAITSRIDDYEVYLKDIISYLNKYYTIKNIDWLKKR